MKQKPFVQQEEIERIQSKLDDTIKRAKDARKKSNMVFDGRWPWRTARENLSDERKNNKPSTRERLTRISKTDKKLKDIYDIKEEFRDIFESENKKAAKEALDNFVNKFGDDYPFLKKMVKTNESEILNRFTDDGKRDIKHWPEQLIEKLRKFERRRGAFRTFESWEMLIDLLLEHSCDEN